MEAERAQLTDAPPQPGTLPVVMLVEADATDRFLLANALEPACRVVEADSGEDALMLLPEAQPDLVLIDSVLPAMSGHETCRRLRSLSDAPVMFISADRGEEAMLEAFDAGALDYVTKPYDIRLVLKKIRAAIAAAGERKRLLLQSSDQNQFMRALSSAMGDGGVLLNFLREILKCEDFLALATRITATISTYGLSCCVRVGQGAFEVFRTSSGEPTQLERSIVEHAMSMGRVFQFRKRLAVNYDNVSIVIFDMPIDEEECGRIRDNLVILCESAQALLEKIARHFEALQDKENVIQTSGKARDHLEVLKALHQQYQSGIQDMLHRFVDDVEAEFRSMDLLLVQEQRISALMERNVSRMLDIFHKSGQDFHQGAEEVIGLLVPDRGNAIELF